MRWLSIVIPYFDYLRDSITDYRYKSLACSSTGKLFLMLITRNRNNLVSNYINPHALNPFIDMRVTLGSNFYWANANDLGGMSRI